MALMERIKHAWNAFMNKDPTPYYKNYGGNISSFRPDRPFRSIGSERTILASVMNRIALDVSNIDIKHVHTDDQGRFEKVVEDGLNSCLTLNANLDQTGRAFIKDVVLSMFDEGCVAIVPVETSENPNVTDSYDIYQLRTGQIIEWRPKFIRARVYNEETGYKEDIMLAKKNVAIIENPFYEVMNEPNSTFKRLVRKLNLLDSVDEQSGSGRLDLIIQLPFVVKSEARKAQAEQRRKEIEMQLAGSKYGIAYTDASEHIVQLNRAVDNNLMQQVEYLTSMLYSQLGITDTIMNGTADEKTMLNYENRTLVPILNAIVESMQYKFLTKTARTQGHKIMYFRDPFKLVPISQIAEIADKFTRNEIMSTNEVRQIVGFAPVKDPHADELRNKNLNPGDGQTFATTTGEERVFREQKSEEENQNEAEA